MPYELRIRIHLKVHLCLPLARACGRQVELTCPPCFIFWRERLVSRQNSYLTAMYTSKTNETTSDSDEIESASTVLFEIILAAMDNSFI